MQTNNSLIFACTHINSRTCAVTNEGTCSQTAKADNDTGEFRLAKADSSIREFCLCRTLPEVYRF